jgi:hypothetical protein
VRSTLHFFDESSDGVLDQVQTAEALIAMESFTRAVEIVLRDSLLRDALTYRPDEALWAFALRQSGYVQARQATSLVLAAVARVCATALSDPDLVDNRWHRRPPVQPVLGNGPAGRIDVGGMISLLYVR